MTVIGEGTPSELIRFFERVTKDRSLQGELARTRNLDAVAAVARALEYEVSGADVLRAQATNLSNLPDADLLVLA